MTTPMPLDSPARAMAQLRCTACGRPLIWTATAGHTPGGLRCQNPTHPRTDNHPHQLRELRALPIRTARLEALVGMVEDNLGVMAGEVVA